MRKFVLAAGALLACGPAFAADDPYSLGNGDYWASYLDNAGRIVATPFASGDVNWTQNAILFGGAVGLFLLDDDIRKLFKNNRNKGSDQAADIFNNFGSLTLLAPATVGAYAIGRYTDDPKLTETGLLGFESLAISGVFGEATKRAVGRERPIDQGRSPDKAQFNGPGYGKEGSFPSGHVTAAFSVASVIAAEYRETPAIGVTAYGVAALTGLARLNDSQHWATDVFAGAALGTGVGLLVYRFRPFGQEQQQFALVPGAGDHPTGLTFKFTF